MSVKTIAGLIPIMSATALVGENVKVASKKKTTTKDIVGLGMMNIVGTSLIKTQAQMLSGL
jgi:hypothetical protein